MELWADRGGGVNSIVSLCKKVAEPAGQAPRYIPESIALFLWILCGEHGQGAKR